MAVSDTRPQRWDINAFSGDDVVLNQRWYDQEANAPYDLTGHTLQLWIGGGLTPSDDFTGATAVTPTIDGDVATFAFTADDERQPIRLALDGETVTAGYLVVSAVPRPGNSGDASVFVTTEAVTAVVSVTVGASGGGGGGTGTVESVNTIEPVGGNVTLTGANVLATGYTVGANVAVAATDTVNEALGKLQAQITAILNAGYVIGENGITRLWGGTQTEYAGEVPAANTAYVRKAD